MSVFTEYIQQTLASCQDLLQQWSLQQAKVNVIDYYNDQLTHEQHAGFSLIAISIMCQQRVSSTAHLVSLETLTWALFWLPSLEANTIPAGKLVPTSSFCEPPLAARLYEFVDEVPCRANAVIAYWQLLTTLMETPAAVTGWLPVATHRRTATLAGPKDFQMNGGQSNLCAALTTRMQATAGPDAARPQLSSMAHTTGSDSVQSRRHDKSDKIQGLTGSSYRGPGRNKRRLAPQSGKPADASTLKSPIAWITDALGGDKCNAARPTFGRQYQCSSRCSNCGSMLTLFAMISAAAYYKRA